jgi:putative MATE family efflux protein
MIVMIIATAVNLILDPLLILGIGFFPRLEVQGAAIATTIAKGMSFLVGFIILLKGRSGIKLNITSRWHLEAGVVKKIFTVGIPIGISYGLMATSIMVVFSIVAAFSKHALAALGIGTRIFQFASLPVVGISIATTTLIGQYLGARDPQRAGATSKTALTMSISIMILCSLLFMIFAGPMINLFTGDNLVIEEGIHFMRIVAVYLLFVGISTSLTGVFRGAGYTLPPMFAGLLKVGLLYALAIILARTMHLGVTGVWWAMIIAYAIESLIIFLWYKQGGWRKKGMKLLDGLGDEK